MTSLLKWASANVTAACVGSSEFVNTCWWVAGCLQRIYLSVLVAGCRDLVMNIDLIIEVYIRSMVINRETCVYCGSIRNLY